MPYSFSEPTTEMDEVFSLLDSVTVPTSLTSYQQTSGRDYGAILRNINVTSFSQLEVLYSCPRKFYLNKQKASQPGGSVQLQANIDFSFGHAVGAGVQNWLMTGDINKALFACFMAWSAEFSASIDKKKKNLHSAMLAVEIFAQSYQQESLGEWELLILPTGKPAIEVGFSFHCGNGFKHYGHMDIALVNKYTKKIRVVDCKTTGGDPEEANYANSYQALSYAIMLQACLPEQLISYEVGYLVYSSENREWHMLPFTKQVEDQAEFIKDLLLSQDMIRTYNETGFFPKRGQACFNFYRRCEYFGECDVAKSKPLPELPEDQEAEKPDYVINLDDVIAQLKMRKRAETPADEFDSGLDVLEIME